MHISDPSHEEATRYLAEMRFPHTSPLPSSLQIDGDMAAFKPDVVARIVDVFGGRLSDLAMIIRNFTGPTPFGML